jgi:hypothetical protein
VPLCVDSALGRRKIIKVEGEKAEKVLETKKLDGNTVNESWVNQLASKNHFLIN